MMKIFSKFLSAVAVFLLAGCNGFSFLDNVVPEAEINKTVTVSPEKNIVSCDGNSVAGSADGTLLLGLRPSGFLSVPGRLEPGQSVSVEKGLDIDIRPAGYVPAEPSGACLELSAVNPYDGRVSVLVEKAAVSPSSGSGNFTLGPFDVTGKSGSCFFAADAGCVPADGAGKESRILPSDLDGALRSPGRAVLSLDGIKVGRELEMIPVPAAVPPTRADGDYSVDIDATLYFPCVYKGGEVLVVERSLSDLGLDVSKYSGKAHSFRVKADVRNSLPFEISVSGESSDGTSVVLYAPVPAGSLDVPSESAVVAEVSLDRDAEFINDAMLRFEFRVPEGGAKLLKGETVVISYKTLKVTAL